MKIKFCGIRREKDIEYVNELLPDYIGFVFAESKRMVSIEQAVLLRKKLDKRIKCVGVFVNEAPKNVLHIAEAVPLDVIQLHGDETAEYISKIRAKSDSEIWKAVRVSSPEAVREAEKLDVDMLLLDSFSPSEYGGTGIPANLSYIKEAGIKKSFFLAGGLNSENILESTKEVNPYGVDISSGIETDGFKSKEKMLEIIKKLRQRGAENE
ncbi:MAG TPA: phosphoribosylanthranilate isomerase [Oscillospiraceae bacterium]|nr:phosphoribosylanthranilate isomerase [Oscillospiraceae bacterium]